MHKSYTRATCGDPACVGCERGCYPSSNGYEPTCAIRSKSGEFIRLVRYLGAGTDKHAHEAQVRWGSNDDPEDVLTKDGIYKLVCIEEHTWHVKYHLLDFPDKAFNSVHFEDVAPEAQT